MAFDRIAAKPPVKAGDVQLHVGTRLNEDGSVSAGGGYIEFTLLAADGETVHSARAPLSELTQTMRNQLSSILTTIRNRINTEAI